MIVIPKKLSRYFLLAAIIGVLFFSIPSFHPAHALVEISDGSIQGLYHFNSSGSLLNDSSTYSRNLTDASGTNVTATSSAKLGDYAASFPSDDILYATSTVMDLSGDYSTGFWMKPLTTLTNNGGI